MTTLTTTRLLIFGFAAALTCFADQAQLKFSSSVVPFATAGDAGASLSFMVVADVNKDGKPDIIATNVLAGTIYVLLGNGDGTFAAPTTIQLNVLPFPVAVADVNGDGKPDLIVGAASISSALSLGPQLLVLLGNGDGTFGTPQVFQPSAFVTALAVGDFNHDGRTDVAIEESADTTSVNVSSLSGLLALGGAQVEIFLGDGAGGFTRGQLINLNSSGGLVLLSADFNGDGKLDLAANQVATGNVAVMLGAGNGTFAAPVTYTGPGLNASYNGLQMAAADVNQDGKIDLVETTGANNKILVFPGNGDGTFGTPQALPLDDAGGLAIADFNGDGIPDFAVGRTGSFNEDVANGTVGAIGIDPIVILPGGPGAATETPVQVGPGSVPIILAAADFNGDGAPDLAAMNMLSGAVTVMINQTLRVQSSAGGFRAFAPESLATIYGPDLASGQFLNPGPGLAATLGGILAQVTDTTGVARTAPLAYVGKGQINFEVPTGTAIGPAQLTISGGPSGTLTAPFTVAAVGPGLFSANSSGTGVAAALAIRSNNSTLVQTPVKVFSCTATAGCVGTPIELDANSTVIVSLYGTGIRGAGTANVTCTVGGVPAKVHFAGAQTQYPGLDQVNIGLPSSLAGKGQVDVILTADGVTSNTVTLTIQ